MLDVAVPGSAGSAAPTRHIRQYPGEASRPTVPTALVNFGESANFPLLLGRMGAAHCVGSRSGGWSGSSPFRWLVR
jgi:hypothetical protein